MADEKEVEEKQEETVEVADPFDIAFAEATGEVKGEVKPDAQVEDPAKEEKGEAEAPAPAEVEVKPDSETIVPPAIPQDFDYNKEIQRRKSLEGMYNSELTKNRKLEEEVEKYRKLHQHEGAEEVQPISEVQPAPIEAESGTEPIGNIFKALPTATTVKDDFEDIYNFQMDAFKNYDALMLKRLSYLHKSLLDQVTPAINTYRSTAEEKHFQKIAEKHSDYEAIVENADFNNWIDENPEKFANEFKRVLREGTATESIWMLDRYKKDRGIETLTPKTTGGNNKQKQLEDMVMVKSKHGPISTKTSKAGGKDDFEGAFDEALKRIS